MTLRSHWFGWRCGAYLLVLAVLTWASIQQLTQPLWDKPEIVLEIGGTYEDLRRNSSAPFSPEIRGHIWSGIPMTDAKLRFVDPQFGFTTPAARFFSVGFDDNIIFGIRMSPQIEPLLLNDALEVALDLQDQWRGGGWRVAGRTRYPPFADTPEWRAQLRDKGGSVYWKAGKKYQVLMYVHRFKYDQRPDEERYLITLSISKPWTPFAEDGDEDALIELDQSIPLTPLSPKKTQGAPPCQLPPS